MRGSTASKPECADSAPLRHPGPLPGTPPKQRKRNNRRFQACNGRKRPRTRRLIGVSRAFFGGISHPSFPLKHALECFNRGRESSYGLLFLPSLPLEGESQKPSRESKADAVGGLLTPHAPLTFSLPFRPGIPRIFQDIRNCFPSATPTTPSSRLRRGRGASLQIRWGRR